MKKGIYLFITLTMCLTIFFANSIFVYAEDKQEDHLQIANEAKSAILIERNTGQILYEKNSHEQLPPASLTKIMTLLLVMEAIDEGKLTKDELITVSARAASMGGSQVFLAEGEQMSVDNLIKAVAIASANDASVALAERLAGSEENFVKQMNEKVKALKLTNTHFENASGLPSKNHYATANDIAIIAKELLKYEDIITYTSIYEDYLRKGEKNEFWLVNTNKLVRHSAYVDGLKTGYTQEAKYCLAATALKEDMRIISVIMGAESSKKRNEMTMQLIDYAFHHYEAEKIYDSSEKVGTFRHLKSEKYAYDVVTSEPITLLHKKGEQTEGIETEIQIWEEDDLPIRKGNQVGQIQLVKDNEVIVTSPLIVKEDITKASIFTLVKRSLANVIKNSK